ncbi:MAG: MarR family EPS-associated transcriptional regulator [Candidatus Sulfobium sp.]|jgi:EPS-associated MarR family transcriptional regulator
MDESHFKTLRELAKDGTISQRELSRRMGLSLGRVNYLVNSLLRQGYIKAKRFKNSKKKIGYMYVVTPKGISTKVAQTYHFLQRKLDEFEDLKREIEALRKESEEEVTAGYERREADGEERFNGRLYE